MFNYGTPYGIYPAGTNALDYLNSLSRDIPNYVVAQNIGKLAPLLRKILSTADVKPISFPFVSQPLAIRMVDNAQKISSDMSFQRPTAIDTELLDMATFYSNLALTTMYITQNDVLAFESNNPNAIIDKLSVNASAIWLGFCDKLATWLYGSRITGGNEDTSQFYGLKDAIDNGTQCPNYGNISRATKTWWNSYIWNAQTLWTDTPPAYVYVIRALNKFQKSASTMGMPQAGFTSPGVWQKLAESFTHIEKYIVADVARLEDTREYAVMGIAINGIPVFPDPYITGNEIFFLNFDHLRFVFTDGYAVACSDWKPLDVVGYLAYFCYILFGGQLVCDAPVASFRLTNMPAIDNI